MVRKTAFALAAVFAALAAIALVDTASACCYDGHGTMDTYSFPGG
jgi:hypothetical protein